MMTRRKTASAQRRWSAARRFTALVLALTMLAGIAAILGSSSPAAAQTTKSVVWDRYDVTLDVRSDGTFHVTERQEIDFQGGPFTGGFADIPLGRIDGLGNLTISEETDAGVVPYDFVAWDDYDAEPNTYTATTTSSEISIRYAFDSVSNDQRTFVMEYDVAGAVRVYADDVTPNQQIWWTAISDEVTEVAPIRESTTTIVLPSAIDDLAQCTASGQCMESGPGEDESDPAAHTTDNKTFTWTASNLEEGDRVEVRLQFPPILNTAAPTWQQQDDERRKQDEENEERGAILNVIFLGIGLLGLAGGGAGLYGLWYSRGRDPHTGVVADFIPNPPDDLPPGAAGTLVDEEAHERDVTATLVDLANRGVLKMDETEAKSILGFGGGRDFNLTALQTDPKVTPFEAELLRSLFGRSIKEGQVVKLSDVKSRFTSATPRIKELLYDELVKRGYFPRSPEQTRSSWRRGGTIALIGVAILGCIGGSMVTEIAPVVWLPIIVLIGLALAIVILSSAMPRKSQAGAEAAAKWKAFKRYLDEIEKYEKVEESSQIFDRYLPYAVAFGLEHSWVTKFASVGAATPDWFGPIFTGGYGGDPFGGNRGYGRRRRGGTVIFGPSVWPGGGGSGGGDRDGDGGGIDMPDLQGSSDRAGRSLQGTSDTLLDMFNTAGKIFGGFGGGGGRGGGWGGGGGGFGGGGSSGGSSGGGGRGFG